MENKMLLSELLRPRRISELILSPSVTDYLERMAKSGWSLNLLFYGAPGIGKTSAARILSERADVIEVDGTCLSEDKALQKSLASFVTSLSLSGVPKICLIDEAEYLSNDAQNRLLKVIENSSRTVRFILTANDVTKLKAALRSRCEPICFDIAPKDRAFVIQRLVDRYEAVLPEFGFECDPVRLREIVGLGFPDLRSIANKLELQFGV